MLVLEKNIWPLKAAEVLQESSGLSAKQVYDLTLLATDDQKKAEDAMAAYAMAEMRAGRTPEV